MRTSTDRPQQTLVVTVTPNPSLDLLYTAESLVWDDANRIAEPRRRPGGQGVNVARAVHVLGATPVAVALLGGRTGEEITSVLQGEGTPLRSVPAAADTRTFVGVREQSRGRSMLLNARGPERSAADETALFNAVLEELERKPEWLACCGSLPPGFHPDLYARLARAAHRHDVKVVVDCDGDPLREAAPLCDLLVPNQHEASRLLGRTVHSLEDAVDATARMPAPIAAITLGAEGAVLRHGADVWIARPPQWAPASTVGAGDSFLAGLLVGLRESDAENALRLAVGAATAALISEGPDLVTREAARQAAGDVFLERVDQEGA